MKLAKKLDCLRLKRELQSRLHKKWKGMNTQQIQAAIEEDLATSQSPLAKWWRQTRKTQAKASRP